MDFANFVECLSRAAFTGKHDTLVCRAPGWQGAPDGQQGALRIHLTRLSTEGLGPRHGEVRRAHQMLNAALCLSAVLLLGLSPFHFPNPGRWPGAEPPADGRPGVSPSENFWNSLCDLVHFDAIWWQSFAGRRTRYICNFAIKIEPICQLQCPQDCTAVLSLLSNEHALKSGTFGVPGTVLPGRGTTWHKFWTSREIRDGWQP